MSRYRLKGFTPVPDALVKKYGATAAIVFGRVWRYTDGGLRDCTASVRTIARALKLTSPTVRKHLKTLIDAGEIIDKTPDLPNAPHTLNVVTQLALTLEIKPGSAIKNLYSGCKETLHKDTIKETLNDKDLKDSKIPKKPRKRDPIFDAIVEVCGLDPKIKSSGSKIGKAKRELTEAGYTAGHVLAYGQWWNSDEWRRNRGPPTVWKLLDGIGTVKTQDAKSRREERQAMHQAESDRHAEKRRRRIHAQDMVRRMEDSEEGQSGTD